MCDGRTTVVTAQPKSAGNVKLGERPSVTATVMSKSAPAGDFVPGGDDVPSAGVSLSSLDRRVDFCLRRDGGADSPMYLKTSGSLSTGRTAVSTSSLRLP